MQKYLYKQMLSEVLGMEKKLWIQWKKTLGWPQRAEAKLFDTLVM